MTNTRTTAFCLIRVFTTALRTAWSFYPTNNKLALAAQILVYMGTIILYIVDLFLAQRLMRARHPKLGWSPLFTIVCPPLVVVATIITVLLVIVAVLQMSYVTNPNTIRIDTDITIYVETFFLFVAFLPSLICLLAVLLPRHTYLDKFGAGRFRTKVAILTLASCLLTFGSAWRTAIAWLPPVLNTEHPWYLSKGAFYGVNFTIEISVLILYLVTRVDRRFYTPDGAKGPFSYSGDVVADDNGSVLEKDGSRVGNTPWGNNFYLPALARTMPPASQSAEGILEDIPEDGSANRSTVTLNDPRYTAYQQGYQAGAYYGHQHQGSEYTIPEGREDGTGPERDSTRKMSMMSGGSSAGSYLEVDKMGRYRLRDVEDEEGRGAVNDSRWTLGSSRARKLC